MGRLSRFFRDPAPGLRLAYVSFFSCVQGGLIIDGLNLQACCEGIGRDQVRGCKVSSSDYGAMSLYKFSIHVPSDYLTCGLKGLVEAQLSRKWSGRAQKVSRYARTALSLCALTLMFAAPPAGLAIGALTAFMQIVENGLQIMSAQRHKADEIIEVGRYFLDPLLRKYYANASFATTFPIHSAEKHWDSSWRLKTGDQNEARTAWFYIVQSFACGNWFAYKDPLLALVGLLKLLGVVADLEFRPPEAEESDLEDTRYREVAERATQSLQAALWEIEKQATETDKEAFDNLATLIPEGQQGLITEARELSEAEIDSLDEDRCHLACQKIKKEDPKSLYCLTACDNGRLNDSFDAFWFNRADAVIHRNMSIDSSIRKKIGRSAPEDDIAAEFAQIEADLRSKVLSLGLPPRAVDIIKRQRTKVTPDQVFTWLRLLVGFVSSLPLA